MLEISFTLEDTTALSKNLSIAYNGWKASCFTPIIPVLVGNSEDRGKTEFIINEGLPPSKETQCT